MELTSIITIIYALCGAIVAFVEMEWIYKNEIVALEKKRELDSSAYAITVLMSIVLWPLLMALRYWTLAKNCKKGIWKINDGTENN